MKSYIFFPVLLQIIGIFIIIAEIFIPSLGLLTIIAICLFFYSIYLVFTYISSTIGMIFIGLDILFVPIIIVFGIKILARSPLALKKKLTKQNGIVSQRPELEEYINMKGISVTALRPAGVAKINMQRIDVVADGEYVEADTSLIVTGVTGNQVIVKKTK